MIKPKDAVKYGRCPECGEEAWLFRWEGTYDNPECLWCEGCIDEAHDRMRDTDDTMNEPVDLDEWNESDDEISDYDGRVIAKLRKALKGHSYQVTIEKRYIIVRVKREGEDDEEDYY